MCQAALNTSETAQICDLLEELLELKTCFTKLKLGEKLLGKSTGGVSDADRSEALKVLFDVLVAQLMKQ